MSKRRMLNKELIESDLFLDMPSSSQMLFVHLILNADDEGFLASPRTVMRMCGGANDDMSLLTAKNYIIPFKSGVVVISDWHKHNQLRKDRVTKTIHTKEKQELQLIENQWSQPNVNQASTKCPHSIVEVSIVESSIVEKSVVKDTDAQEVFKHWLNFSISPMNTIGIAKPRKLTQKIVSSLNGIKRDGYKIEDVKRGIDNYFAALRDDSIFFSHIWTLPEFLQREGGCRKFADLNEQSAQSMKKYGKSNDADSFQFDF